MFLSEKPSGFLVYPGCMANSDEAAIAVAFTSVALSFWNVSPALNSEMWGEREIDSRQTSCSVSGYPLSTLVVTCFKG